MSSLLFNGLAYAFFLPPLAVEYFHRVPFAKYIAALTGTSGRAIRIMRSKNISDHWKEIVLLRYARDTFIGTVKLGSLLIGCAMLLVVPALLLDRLVAPSPSVLNAIASMPGLLVMTMSSLIYVTLRRWLGKIRL